MKDLMRTYTPAEWRRHEEVARKVLDEDQFPDYVRGNPDLPADEDRVITEPIDDPWTAPHMFILRRWIGDPIDPIASKVEEPPIGVPGLEIKPAEAVRDWVLASAGARPRDRDAVDARIVEEVRTRTGSIRSCQDDVGGWPDLEENRRELTLREIPSADE